ncbi:hypothetical protein GALL_207760 [mine drainage metagenome]|uniref:Uncharacterized protein n=1 Tax=mine drainage metagenome TaxID=410659 RepID=A0A1J5RMG4_9ZZZZ
MSFSRKIIEVDLLLGSGPDGTSGQRRLTLSGLKAQVRIEEVGNEQMGTATVRLAGLSPEHRNALSALNSAALRARDNRIRIKAGDASGLALLFQGSLQLGRIDMTAAPEAAVQLVGMAGGWDKMALAKPSAYPGATPVARIMADLAAEMGYLFENNGVNSVLHSPSLAGPAWEKARRVAEAAAIDWCIGNGVLAIWPQGGYRTTPVVPLLSKETGLVGYPGYLTGWNGVCLTSLFNPALKLGGLVDVQSAVVGVANGRWVIRTLAHELDSETPGGAWLSHVETIEMGAA